MPELPEVETVCRGLAEYVPGKYISQVEVAQRQLRRLVPDELEDMVAGCQITSISRRAKYIIISLADASCSAWENRADKGGGQYAIIIHLGMSGRVRFAPNMDSELAEPRKHDHVVFYLSDVNNDNDANQSLLIYNDPRRFGLVTYCQKNSLAEHDLFNKLGPEPFSGEFNSQYLLNKAKGRVIAIKQFIMDAHIVVGVGNIYASEALFASRIHPEMPAGQLSEIQAMQLVTEIRNTLQKAIDAGGSTLRDYGTVDDKTGYFQHQFMVYGRAGEPCYVCGNEIRSIRQQNRSTFYCEHCQPLPHSQLV